MFVKCRNPVYGHYCQGCALLRKKFKEDLFVSCVKNEILQDFSGPSNDNSNVANALREPFVVNLDPGNNSSQSPPQISNHYCYGCGDPLEGIFCHQCTCKLCGNGAHYGYNCPPKVPIIPDLEPFNNQTIKELPPTVQSSDPKSDLVHNSPNVFSPSLPPPIYSYKFCGNDAYYCQDCSLQVPFTYDPEACYNQDFNFLQNFQTFQQYPCCTRCGGPQYHDEIKIDELKGNFNSMSIKINKKENLQQLEQVANLSTYPSKRFNSFCYDDDDDDDKDYAIAVTPSLSTEEPDNSLSMGNEHLDTIPATESDEFIKSSVENLVSIPSESEGESECDVVSFYDEDIPKKIYLNPLFDEEIIPMKIDPHHFNAKSDLIESLLNNDSSIIPSSKIDSLFDEFADELTLLKSIPPGLMKLIVILRKKLILSRDYCTITHLLDSDSLMEEINLSFTPDYPMPPGIKDDDYDSERDILILKDLPNNDTLSFPAIESFHFDIPSFSRPPTKPPHGNTRI
uniref:Uncharacterized protein n=1 Tax=Tanacetum cinerariifolium TaxID=118510 RepID=A0A6L2KTJ2_TANCI|nr:hypothetical protein [Tanacetum cinerariifolium]